MHIVGGWLKPAEYRRSPNCNQRPEGEISLIIVHNISLPAGHFGNHYVEELFCNQLPMTHPDFQGLESVKVSAHLFIRRSGKVIQFVPFDQRAWHAGNSRYLNRSDCNDFSIGIELEGTDKSSYRNEQYLELVQVCKLLIAEYDIEVDAILGHADVAPGRKTDPGEAFDWPYFRDLLNQ